MTVATYHFTSIIVCIILHSYLDMFLPFLITISSLLCRLSHVNRSDEVHGVHTCMALLDLEPESVSPSFFGRPLALAFCLPSKIQATKTELKAKTDALATNDRQRVQYEAIAKSKQQQLDQLMSAKAKMQEDLEAREKAALAKAAASEGKIP